MLRSFRAPGFVFSKVQGLEMLMFLFLFCFIYSVLLLLSFSECLSVGFPIAMLYNLTGK